jgi:hypothetical protein
VVPAVEVPGRSVVATAVATMPDELPYVGEVDLRGDLLPPPITTTLTDDGGIAVVADRSPLVGYFAGTPRWMLAAAVIYAIGLAMLLIRWGLAARFIAKLRRQSTPISTVQAGVFESALAATPITVGALRPWIVLPTEWRSWPAPKLAGVLAHELAHVERRDPLIALLAYVNRCIFWFHPLAWWLERKLAATAEDAADDAGARAMGQERAYAEVLVDMAAIVHRAGGRVAWEGVGVDGNGLLGQRIDRLLSGNLFREVSRMKKVVIAVVSAVAVFVAVACRPRIEPAPLAPNPKVAEALAVNDARSAEFDGAKALTKEGAEALEANVRQNPDDLDSRRKLLIFYRWSGWKVLGTEATIKNRRAHVLWLIEHKPEDPVTVGWAYLNPDGDLSDRDGYEAGRRLWLAHTAKPSPSLVVLTRAANYLAQGGYAEQAEGVLLKAQAAYPDDGRVLGALADLYANAIAGATPSVLGRRAVADPVKARSPFALRVRQLLDASRDANLIARTALLLDRASATEAGSDETLQQLAQAYAARAAQMGPASKEAARALATLRDHEVQIRVNTLRRAAGNDPSKWLAAVQALPESEQFAMLPWVADEADMAGDAADYYQHDAARAKANWDVAQRAAAAVLSLAPRFSADPNQGPNVFRARAVLGLGELRAGQMVKAVAHLTAAGEAAPSPIYAAAPMQGRYYQLANYLLKYGERESVARFYEKYADLLGAGDGRHQRMLDAAAAIRAGQMPEDYQRFFKG